MCRADAAACGQFIPIRRRSARSYSCWTTSLCHFDISHWTLRRRQVRRFFLSLCPSSQCQCQQQSVYRVKQVKALARFREGLGGDSQSSGQAISTSPKPSQSVTGQKSGTCQVGRLFWCGSPAEPKTERRRGARRTLESCEPKGPAKKVRAKGKRKKRRKRILVLSCPCSSKSFAITDFSRCLALMSLLSRGRTRRARLAR